MFPETMISSGITGLHIKVQSRESVNMLVAGICPQCCECISGFCGWSKWCSS